MAVSLRGFKMGGAGEGMNAAMSHATRIGGLALQGQALKLEDEKTKAAQSTALQKQIKDLGKDIDASLVNLETALTNPDPDKRFTPEQLQATVAVIRRGNATLEKLDPKSAATVNATLEKLIGEVRETPDEIRAKRLEDEAKKAGKIATVTAEATQAVQNSPEAIAAAAKKAGAITAATQAATPDKPLTEAGKRVFDRALVAKQFGADSPQAKAFEEAATLGDVKLSDVAGVRKEFTTASQDMIKVKDSFEKIAAAAKSTTPASDMSMIFGYMKLLDPTSTVREGEQAQAQQTTGIPGRIVNMYNKSLSGNFLDPQQKKEFADEAEKIFKIYLRSHLSLEEQYKGIAGRNGMKPEDVVVDYLGAYRQGMGGTNTTTNTGGVPRVKADLNGNIITDVVPH